MLDIAGAGSPPDLINITGDANRVVSIADFSAPEHGVRLSRTEGPGGTTGPATPARPSQPVATHGQFTVPVHAVLPLVDCAGTHELSASPGNLRPADQLAGTGQTSAADPDRNVEMAIHAGSLSR